MPLVLARLVRVAPNYRAPAVVSAFLLASQLWRRPGHCHCPGFFMPACSSRVFSLPLVALPPAPERALRVAPAASWGSVLRQAAVCPRPAGQCFQGAGHGRGRRGLRGATGCGSGTSRQCLRCHRGDTRLSSRLAHYHNNGRSQQVPCPGAPRTGRGLEHCARPGPVRTEGGGARLGSVRKAARRGAAAGPENRRGSAGLGARARRAGGPRDWLGRAAGSFWMRWFVHWRSIRDPVGRHTFPVAHVRFLLDGSGRGA